MLSVIFESAGTAEDSRQGRFHLRKLRQRGRKVIRLVAQEHEGAVPGCQVC